MKKFVIIVAILVALFVGSIVAIGYSFLFTELPVKIIKLFSNNENFKVKNISGTIASGISITEMEINKGGANDLFLKVKSLVIKYNLLDVEQTNQFTLNKFYIDDLYVKSSNYKKNRSSVDNKIEQITTSNKGKSSFLLKHLRLTNITIDNDDETSKPFFIEIFELENFLISNSTFFADRLILKSTVADLEGRHFDDNSLNLEGILKSGPFFKLKKAINFKAKFSKNDNLIKLTALSESINVFGTLKKFKITINNINVSDIISTQLPINNFKATITVQGKKIVWHDSSFLIKETTFKLLPTIMDKKRLATFESIDEVAGAKVKIIFLYDKRKAFKLKIESTTEKKSNELLSLIIFKQSYKTLSTESKDQIDNYANHL